MLGQRQPILEKRCADEFVDGIVAANILPRCNQHAKCIKKPCGVQSSGMLEHGLCLA